MIGQQISIDNEPGPWVWKNWRRAHGGDPQKATVEMELFTDAWVIAEAECGPYNFVNGVPITRHEGQYDFKAAIILRVSHFIETDWRSLGMKTDAGNYHGGSIYDEVAALSSLVLGVRMIAGPVTREFDGYTGPMGRPQTHSPLTLPSVPPRTTSPLVPWLFQDRDLRQLEQLNRLIGLDGPTATALVKSARLFQQALYVCDFAPEISWLLLVSALETAAVQWSAHKSTAIERLRASYPDLVALLDAQANPSLTGEVAYQLARLTGATAKFRGFCMAFQAPPPSDRPEYGRFDFDGGYEKAIKTIYDHRSSALHSGVPFPYPMCLPPHQTGSATAAECPLGLATHARGATWHSKDTPMLLHLFAYIARKTLLAWWDTAADNCQSVDENDPAIT
jgi:hypothetical protein